MGFEGGITAGIRNSIMEIAGRVTIFQDRERMATETSVQETSAVHVLRSGSLQLGMRNIVIQILIKLSNFVADWMVCHYFCY